MATWRTLDREWSGRRAWSITRAKAESSRHGSTSSSAVIPVRRYAGTALTACRSTDASRSPCNSLIAPGRSASSAYRSYSSYTRGKSNPSWINCARQCRSSSGSTSGSNRRRTAAPPHRPSAPAPQRPSASAPRPAPRRRARRGPVSRPQLTSSQCFAHASLLVRRWNADGGEVVGGLQIGGNGPGVDRRGGGGDAGQPGSPSVAKSAQARSIWRDSARSSSSSVS
ncbi:hypothetical protein QF035_009246 [Streptomyces umbrinus]|uniref:Uncharacterized protein n=1 Tax=Streptomyces umbrinus TaxID=67370 RepID=A0ABU0T780_9ACTN|nr:hypothetical protein [Streptomyces umbrinus]